MLQALRYRSVMEIVLSFCACLSHLMSDTILPLLLDILRMIGSVLNDVFCRIVFLPSKGKFLTITKRTYKMIEQLVCVANMMKHGGSCVKRYYLHCYLYSKITYLLGIF